MKNRRSHLSRSRHRSFWGVSIILLIGILVTSAAFWHLRKYELAAFQIQFEKTVSCKVQLFIQRLEEDMLVLCSMIEDLRGNAERVNRPQFIDFATKLLEERKEIDALGWVPRIGGGEQEKWKKRAESEGSADYQVTEWASQNRHPAAKRDVHYPIFYIHPLKGNEKALGIDFSPESPHHAAMQQAGDTGKPVISTEATDSERLPIVRKTASQGSFLILVPVYQKGMPVTNTEERRIALEGFVVGAFHTIDLMGASMSAAPGIGFFTDFLNLSAPSDRQVIRQDLGRTRSTAYESWKKRLGFEYPHFLKKFTIAGNEMGLNLTAASHYVDKYYPLGHYILLIGGLLLTFFLALYIHTILAHWERSEHASALASANQTLVTEVCECRRGEEELRQHRDQLETMVTERTVQLLIQNSQLTEEISERKRGEEELRRSRDEAEAANRAKDQFIAVLSHELRTPLTPVLASISALQAEKNLPAEARAELGMIRRNVELEAKLIDDLLDVTRISRGKIELHNENVDAHACIRTALDICQSEIAAKGLTLSLNLCTPQAQVWADPARLCQVFWNLLQNAVKFTPKGGQIDLLSTSTQGRIKIEITDTGIGIEPEVLPRIFNAFEQGEQTKTRQFGGLGLGLSIAKTIVELHQGSITASSRGKDQGATFTVELKTISVIPEPAPTPPALPPSQKQQWNILLVDDHADTLRIMSKLLRRSGCTVTIADSVQSALERADDEVFDLLISDLGLPDGSGMDIIRQVKERYGLRGIAISGFGSEEDVRQSRDAGFEAHIIKPISFEHLRTAMQQIVSQTA